MLIGYLALAAILLMGILRAKSTYYICPHCGARFSENIFKSIFSVRTFFRRMIVCPKCGHIDAMRPRYEKNKGFFK